MHLSVIFFYFYLINKFLVQEETFAPILYVFPIKSFREAIKINNIVTQGLSSSIYTKNFEYTRLVRLDRGVVILGLLM